MSNYVYIDLLFMFFTSRTGWGQTEVSMKGKTVSIK